MKKHLTLKDLKDIVEKATILGMKDDSKVLIRNLCWPVPEKTTSPYIEASTIRLINPFTQNFEEREINPTTIYIDA